MDGPNSILTDSNAIKVALWIICLMGGAIVSLLTYLFAKILSEIKADKAAQAEEKKADRLAQEAFTNELKNKFRALNSYVRVHDRTSLIHGEKIHNLAIDHQEYKKKLMNMRLF